MRRGSETRSHGPAAVRHRPLTARGAGALTLGTVGMIAANVFGAPVLLYLGVLLVLLVVLAALLVHLPRREGTVTRTIATDLLTVGEESHVLVRFGLRSAFGPPVGRWEDALPAAVAADASGRFPPAGSGRRERGPEGIPIELSYDIRGVRRGLWALGPLALTTGDPFALVRRRQKFGEVRRITVVPEVVAIGPFADRAGAAAGTAQTSSSRIGQGADNLAPRRYVTGDSMRRVHWRATAHRGDLMVRQEEQESSPDAIIVLDRAGVRWPRSSSAAAAHGEADPVFERAVSACASLALHLSEHGYGVDVVDATNALIGRLRGLEDDRDALLVALAATAPRSGERDERMTAASDGHLIGPLVVITGAIGADDAAALAHRGAGTPVLLPTDPSPDALAAARAQGWSASRLGDDIAASWAEAVSSSPAPSSAPASASSRDQDADPEVAS
ncbi:DUF58 domain-containing protein [Microbacterium pseudoresistens]|uniref:Uncharacterized protein (DUF58 family) n=1 Tax=Microbacterium pseudoresistens TaxID=640634 RepID=A0A7Y9EVT9_9MICO|nr:DUF58 domain-containing protein [Microbacterium pseudoresistens]NYD54736.1 uncharacterized protein (DUF58 family) [Microbacterium pseudoresistens]